ncbi:MAG: NADH-quinone oxidoreductase subunit L, partial [candidate division WOR-3 bacterium]
HVPEWMLMAAALLLFLGAVGKSAQFPLYVWLPDAMEGPTPVSALIHAATMVTAGVYMVARSSALYSAVPFAGYIVAGIGAFTAALAASMAMANNDIKRILAYSTISQLGYMFIAVGLGAYAAGIFHLYTHAFFKGLLFLAAGSVMHVAGGELDIQRMGGLARKAPQTAALFIIGSLALSGIPPLAGFFSKDEILHAAAASGYTWIWVLGTITAFMTAFYMFRAVFLVFTGKPRDEHIYEHAHESGWTMTVPMWFLAAGAVAAGWAGPLYHAFIAPVFSQAHEAHGAEVNSLTLIIISVSVAVLGILVAGFMYWRPGFRNRALSLILRPFYIIPYRKYWVDEIYDWVIVKPLYYASLYPLYKGIDTYIIDKGLVDGTGWLARAGGRLARAFQGGNARTYALLMLAGLVLIFYLVLLK